MGRIVETCLAMQSKNVSTEFHVPILALYKWSGRMAALAGLSPIFVWTGA